jgi:hypothetical protein
MDPSHYDYNANPTASAAKVARSTKSRFVLSPLLVRFRPPISHQFTPPVVTGWQGVSACRVDAEIKREEGEDVPDKSGACTTSRYCATRKSF